MKKLALYKCFNPRTHTGCDFAGLTDSHDGIWFQSTHPHGVRPLHELELVREGAFQSTHPHGVRPSPRPRYRYRWCFNPRTHTGCDDWATRAGRARLVSIHAPTRGATFRGVQACLFLRVSIHAPTRGATYDGRIKCQILIVSIHAPTRGATLSWIARMICACCFNPRTHTGCDLKPRPSSRLFHVVSIHAPTRGATNHKRFGYNEPIVSIHAPTRGATSIYLVYTIIIFVSIHAPTRGATLW